MTFYRSHFAVGNRVAFFFSILFAMSPPAFDQRENHQVPSYWLRHTLMHGGQCTVTAFGKITFWGNKGWKQDAGGCVRAWPHLETVVTSQVGWWYRKTDRQQIPSQVPCLSQWLRDIFLNEVLHNEVMSLSHCPWIYRPACKNLLPLCQVKLFYLVTWRGRKSGPCQISIKTEFTGCYTLTALTMFSAPPKSLW